MTTQPNPLEKIFNIEPGSTPTFVDPVSIVGGMNEREVSLIDPTSGEMIERSTSPEQIELEKEERLEDMHIDGQLECVHNTALIAFEKSSRMADEADPRFAARNAEVAAQYLNIALNAVNSRVDAKYKRNKVRMAAVKAGAPSAVTNNVFIGDRNQLLREIFAGQAIPVEEDKHEAV
jgi:hypothetical protein